MPHGPLALPGRGPVPRFEAREAQGWLPRGYIDGLILSNDTTDAVNDIAIAAGCARSTTAIVDGVGSTLARDQIDLELPVSIIKQLDVAFAPDNYDPEGYSGGGRSGGRIGTLADGTWHVFLVGGRGVQTDVVILNAVTFTSATLPSQYSAWRMIGSLVRLTSIKAFIQQGDYFVWKDPVLDVNAATPGTSAVTVAITVPTGLRLRVTLEASENSAQLYIASPETTDSAPSPSAAPLASMGSAAVIVLSQVHAMTDTSAQIRYRSSANNQLYIATVAFWHPRGRDS